MKPSTTPSSSSLPYGIDWTSSTRAQRSQMYKHTSRAYDLLATIRLPVCRKIIDVLGAADHPLTVTEIFVKLRMEQCEVSRHLSRLRRHGVVSSTKHRQNQYYTLHLDRLQAIKGAISRFLHPQE